MDTIQTYDSFLEHLYLQLRSGKKYELEIEITSGDAIATGEIFNCERRIRVYDSKDPQRYVLDGLVSSGLTFDNKDEKDRNVNETIDDFFIALQSYISKRSQGLEPAEVVRENNTFKIKGEIYHGKRIPRRELAARLRELRDSL